MSLMRGVKDLCQQSVAGITRKPYKIDKVDSIMKTSVFQLTLQHPELPGVASLRQTTDYGESLAMTGETAGSLTLSVLTI
jgi:hypothetical protein